MLFEEIWQADMDGNGVLPLIKGVSDSDRNDEKGYVIVDMDPFSGRGGRGERNREVNVLTNVTIPEEKMASYNIFQKFHNNYDWHEKENDPVTEEEENEIRELLEFSIKTPPMKIVRDYALEKKIISNGTSDEEWLEQLKDIWFGQYQRNSTSAFEHIFMGEQKGTELNGHHFWYHYYINDGPFEVTHVRDAIHFLKTVEVVRAEQSHLAEVITIKYNYEEVDSAGNKTVLQKKKGGFFVGTSTEGLIALGTAAFFDGRENVPIELNGEKYDLAVFKAQDDPTKLRTFFPKIKQHARVGH
ncbi:hypothetical protein FQU75_22910 [Paenibacillus polymyxa]|nr:hypothetical protein FQU75_22910 [Paenibacillus polymyxa]